jgi:hypothetical protein
MDGPRRRARYRLDRLPDGCFVLWRTTGALTWVVAEGHGRALGWLVAYWWRLLRSRPPGPPRQAERPGLELVDS